MGGRRGVSGSFNAYTKTDNNHKKFIKISFQSQKKSKKKKTKETKRKEEKRSKIEGDN